MNYEEFSELAPLWVLDVLDEEERHLVEEFIAESPEYQAELTQLRDTVSAIPYSAPPVPMAANLKERLFERIAGVDSEQNRSEITQGTAPSAIAFPPIATVVPLVTVRASDVRWKPHPVPGIAIARLHIDKARREIVCLLRADPGVRYPAHRHAGTEEIFMLEGDLTINGEVFGKGDYIRSTPGSIHSPHTLGGCMFLIRTSLEDEILN
jgi:anti-sigma factor ChrR (cupin superfamily)